MTVHRGDVPCRDAALGPAGHQYVGEQVEVLLDWAKGCLHRRAVLTKLGFFFVVVKIGHFCQNWVFLSKLGVFLLLSKLAFFVEIGHFCQNWVFFVSKLSIKKIRFAIFCLLLLSS
jgi:hypothetical protein